MRERVFPGAVAALVLAAASLAAAGEPPFPEKDLPPSLKPWVAWVLDDAPDRLCTPIGDGVVCLWPGRLRLDLGAKGGTFVQEVWADREQPLRLPGDAQHWPQDVRLDGKAAPVVAQEDAPTLRLPAGSHRVEGRFAWAQAPDSLPVPPQTAMFALVLDGRAVSLPAVEDGVLWLRREGSADASEGESLRLQVFRKISDGIPMWVETRLALEASGKARELQLTGALLDGTEPVAVSGDLPARVDGSRVLHVQVRPGQFSVSVLARVQGRPEAFAAPASADPWPNREVWVFEPADAFRQVELAGAAAIDASRTELPQDWRAMPAFVLDPRQQLTLKEVRRGEPEAPPDAVRLARELWLDQGGHGFTVRDVFSGTVHRTTRLDLQAPGVLGRASVDGTDQLVTVDPRGGQAGVELRRSALDLRADSRVEGRGALPAVGWAVDVEQLQGALHLPPGWTVLAARGVDAVPGAWTTRWNLLGFFFVLIVAIGTARLFGPKAGVLALVAMVLAFDEPGAPQVVWLSLLAAVALRRVVPAGRLASVARVWWLVSVLVLAVIAAPFYADQIRGAIYPQVMSAPSSYAPAGMADMAVRSKSMAVPEAPPPASLAPQEAGNAAPEDKEKAARKLSSLGRLGAEKDERQQQAEFNAALEQEPHAVLQTGPGVPQWTWSTYPLTWSGPVTRDHRMHLLLVSPLGNAFLTFLRLGLMLALAFVLIGGRREPTPAVAPEVTPEPEPPSDVAPGDVAPLLLVLALLLPLGARADEPGAQPSPEAAPPLLGELREKLTRPEPCRPECVDTPSLVVRMAGEQIAFTAEVHAQAAADWAIPGPASVWVPSSVSVDGQATSALVRLDDGFLHVRLAPGVHRVEAGGVVPAQDTLTLQLADRPRHARAEAPGWDVVGVRDDGPPESSIQLTRRMSVGSASRETSSYAPWLEITRTLMIGVTWRVETTVHRVSPTGAPVSVQVPLLPGESPTESDLAVQAGQAVVSLSGGQTDAHWTSTLAQVPSLALTAPSGKPWSEVWRLQCGVVWECRAEGLAPVHHEREGLVEPEYRPWPGESVTVAFAHPSGAPGQTLTFDSVTLDVTPGVRLQQVTLTLQSRSSREQPVTLTLPADAELQTVTIGGSARNARPEGGKLRLVVPPGAQAIELKWHQPRGMGIAYGMPRVGLSVPAVNVTAALHLPPPSNRWLLFTRGPSWGPAILFWGTLLFVLVVSAALSLVPGSPLRLREWLLLGLGLSQVTLLEAAIVATFFLLLAWRARRPPARAFVFNLLQLVLLVWALVTFGVLYHAVETGLAGGPDMQVQGNESSAELLRWYADRVADTTPAAGVLSLPLWAYRGAMLLWALWLAASLIRWLGWAWRSWTEGGAWKTLLKLRQRKDEEPKTP